MIKLEGIPNKILKEETNNTFIQLIRYTFVGGISFLIDFGTLALFTECFGVYYLLSAIIGFVFGLSVNYLLSIIWVFNNSSIGSRFFEILFFTAIGIIGLALNELFIWTFTDKLNAHYLLSKNITAIIVCLWNFFARKYLLFNNHQWEKQP